MTIDILRSVAMLDVSRREQIKAQLQALADQVDSGQITLTRAMKLARRV